MTAPDLTKVIGIILSIGPQAAKAGIDHSEAAITVLKTLGIDVRPAPDFDSIYIHTLVRYGIYKPELVLNFFRLQLIRDAFRSAYYADDPSILSNVSKDVVDWNEEAKALGTIDYDPRREIDEFRSVFDDFVLNSRTPADAMVHNLLRRLLRKRTEERPDEELSEGYQELRSDARHTTAEDNWIQGGAHYQLDLPDVISDSNLAALTRDLSEWKFITSSAYRPIAAIANGVLGIGQTDGTTLALSPAPAIMNCSVECDILIAACGTNQSNWAGIQLRAFDFVADFRLGYLIYLRRSGQVELYSKEGILAGLGQQIVEDPGSNWTHLRVDILDSGIRVYVNHNEKPHIAVDDKSFGGAGRIYLDTFGTHAQFRNLQVRQLSRGDL